MRSIYAGIIGQHNKRWAAVALLMLPASFYILLYLVPLGSVISLSVDNGEVSGRLAQFSKILSIDDKDVRVGALLADMVAMSSEAQGETARMLNQELVGFRSLFLKTARQAAQITPNWQGLVDFDQKWQQDEYWQVLERNAHRFTWRHFHKILGLAPDGHGNLTRQEGGDIYLQIMGRTLIISVQVTLLTLLIGYPLAYVAAHGGARLGHFVLMVVLLSFWTSVLVRSTAWVVLLQTNGIVNGFLLKIGLVDAPLQLIFNRFGTLVAMTHVLLPFAIIPMMNVMRSIPSAQNAASRSLGAGAVETFLRVYFPQSLRGVTVGGGIVFILSLGFYVTPALTGGPGDQMLSYYIADLVRRSLNWGLASALSILLLLSVIILLSIYGGLRWLKEGR